MDAMASHYLVPDVTESQMGNLSNGAFAPDHDEGDKELEVITSSLNHEYNSSAPACSATMTESALTENDSEDEDTEAEMFTEPEEGASPLDPGYIAERTLGRPATKNENFNSLQFSDPKNPLFDAEMPFLEPAMNVLAENSTNDYLDVSAELSDQPSNALNMDMEMPFLEQLGIPGKTSGSSSPFPTAIHPPASPSYVDIFDLKQLLRSGSVPSFLGIPLLCGLERIVVEKTMDNVLNGDGCVVHYRLQDKDQILRNFDEVHRYLMENEIEIPISFFCFDPEILIHAVHKTDPDMLKSKDLSEGQERVPISVLCLKNSQDRLSNYITKSFLDENLTKSLRPDHEDGFLVCCNCPNDCSDKMNCPCFLKTLDNCSEETRQAVGDENVGYNYQRLEQEFLSGIFECNKLCGCHKQTCFNRVVQNGMFCNLQVYMTRYKGWGVRTLADIPKGTFICTYAGKIVGADYAEAVSKTWSDGNWKYLSELRIGEEGKPDYEEEVIEPELETPEVVNNEVGDKNGDKSIPTVPESSNTPNPADAVAPTPFIESDLTPGAVELHHDLDDKDDPSLYSIRSIFPIVRSTKELALLAQLTMRSLLRSESASSRRHPVPRRRTQFIFRRDYAEFYSRRDHTKIREEEEYDEADDVEYMQLPEKEQQLQPERTTQITREMADTVARSIKLREKPKQRPIAPDLKLIAPNRPGRPRAIGKKPKTKRIKAAMSIHGTTDTKRNFTKIKRLGGGNKPIEPVHPLLDLSLNIDGVKEKNVGGYVNHSCNPNIFPQYVFWDCHDLRLPVIAFFASRNIQRGEELSWNYKYELEQFLDPEEHSNKQKKLLPCFCTEDNCKRTMYSS